MLSTTFLTFSATVAHALSAFVTNATFEPVFVKQNFNFHGLTLLRGTTSALTRLSLALSRLTLASTITTGLQPVGQ